MKIGVISDTHRNVDLIEEAVDWLIRKQKITMLYHLGDDYDDVLVLQDRYLETVQSMTSAIKTARFPPW